MDSRFQPGTIVESLLAGELCIVISSALTIDRKPVTNERDNQGYRRCVFVLDPKTAHYHRIYDIDGIIDDAISVE